MAHVIGSRRFILALVSVGCLTALGFYTSSTDVAIAISAVVVGVAGANAFEGRKNGNGNN